VKLLVEALKTKKNAYLLFLLQINLLHLASLILNTLLRKPAIFKIA